MITIDSSGN